MHRTTTSGDERRYAALSGLVVAIVVVLVIVQTIDYMNFTVDDVFIPMRVAVNIAAGRGPVYNEGEYVEGFSDPLWVAALVGGLRSGVLPDGNPMALLWLARMLSLGFGICSIVGARHLVRMLVPYSSSASMDRSLVALLISACAPFLLWSCGALEMTLVSCCYVTAAVAAAKLVRSATDRGFSSMTLLWVSLAAASLSRPEPPLIAGVLFAYVLCQRDDRLRCLLLCLLPYTLVLGSFEWWRWTTYHAILPNTYYAKTGGGIAGIGMGLKYLFGAVGATTGAALLAVPFAYGRGAALSKPRTVVTLIVSAQVFFTVLSTGDWMPGARFLIPVVPLVLALAVAGIRFIMLTFGLARSLRSRPYLSFALIVTISLCEVFAGRTSIRGEVPGLRSGLRVHTGYSLEEHEAVGKWLQTHARSGESFATGEAGLMGYMNPDLRLIDLNGLMDIKIARDRKAGVALDCEYVVRRSPDYVLIDHSPDAIFYNDIYSQLRCYSGFTSNYSLAEQIGYTEIYIRRDRGHLLAR